MAVLFCGQEDETSKQVKGDRARTEPRYRRPRRIALPVPRKQCSAALRRTPIGCSARRRHTVFVPLSPRMSS